MTKEKDSDKIKTYSASVPEMLKKSANIPKQQQKPKPEPSADKK